MRINRGLPQQIARLLRDGHHVGAREDLSALVTEDQLVPGDNRSSPRVGGRIEAVAGHRLVPDLGTRCPVQGPEIPAGVREVQRVAVDSRRRGDVTPRVELPEQMKVGRVSGPDTCHILVASVLEVMSS